MLVPSIAPSGKMAFSGGRLQIGACTVRCIPPILRSGRTFHALAGYAAQAPRHQQRFISSGHKSQSDAEQPQPKQEVPSNDSKKKKKTMAELDEELRLKLEGASGEGGASGVEYEGGRAEGLKRGVKDNMFRVI